MQKKCRKIFISWDQKTAVNLINLCARSLVMLIWVKLKRRFCLQFVEERSHHHVFLCLLCSLIYFYCFYLKGVKCSEFFRNKHLNMNQQNNLEGWFHSRIKLTVPIQISLISFFLRDPNKWSTKEKNIWLYLLIKCPNLVN